MSLSSPSIDKQREKFWFYFYLLNLWTFYEQSRDSGNEFEKFIENSKC